MFLNIKIGHGVAVINHMDACRNGERFSVEAGNGTMAVLRLAADLMRRGWEVCSLRWLGNLDVTLWKNGATISARVCREEWKWERSYSGLDGEDFLHGTDEWKDLVQALSSAGLAA